MTGKTRKRLVIVLIILCVLSAAMVGFMFFYKQFTTKTLVDNERIRVVQSTRKNQEHISFYPKTRTPGFRVTDDYMDRMMALPPLSDTNFDNTWYGIGDEPAMFSDSFFEITNILLGMTLPVGEPLTLSEDDNDEVLPRHPYFGFVRIYENSLNGAESGQIVEEVTIAVHSGKWRGVRINGMVDFLPQGEKDGRLFVLSRGTDFMRNPTHEVYEAKDGFIADLFTEARQGTEAFFIIDGSVVYDYHFDTEDLAIVKAYLDTVCDDNAIDNGTAVD